MNYPEARKYAKDYLKELYPRPLVKKSFAMLLLHIDYLEDLLKKHGIRYDGDQEVEKCEPLASK